MRQTLCVGIALLAGAASLQAEVTVSTMFGDHMVLQRQMPVPVWGKATPGQTVTVRFSGQEVSTTADDHGRWKVALPAMKGSAEGRPLSVEGPNVITFRDVLVGEVWICSGQSNMQYGWGKKSDPMFNWGGDEKLAKLAEQVEGKPIRSYLVKPNAAFEPLDDANGGWSDGISGSAVAFGLSYYLHEALDVPVAVIVTCWGSSCIEGWMPLDMTEQLPHYKEMMDGLLNSEQAMARVNSAIAKGIRPGFVFVRKQPNLLYNAMLHPVIPYACRGFVWYQGEANASRYGQYERSFRLWVQRLRKAWGREDMHFLTVMLPGYDHKDWPYFREVQLQSLDLSHTGVVNTIDLGDAKNIHPPDKAPIARRLALLARSDVYDRTFEGGGPMFAGWKGDGNTMVIHFDHAKGLTTTDGKPPKGFMLAGEDKKWHAATARIDGKTVVLTAPGVDNPVACRYAFEGKPEVNLVNGKNLPVYPFRTDRWEQ